MKRVTIFWRLLNSLFLIVFNLLFFMFGDVKNFETSVWISYGFIHFAYFLLLLTPCFVRPGNMYYAYRRPLFLVTTTYFFVELFVGVMFIIVAPETVKVTIAVQTVLVAMFIAWLLAHLIANEHTADNVEKREDERKYVKISAAELNSIMRQISDNTLKRKVERVYDVLRNSPLKSSSEVFQIEQDVIDGIGKLRNAVAAGETEHIVQISDRIFHLAEERNHQLKTGNR